MGESVMAYIPESIDPLVDPSANAVGSFAKLLYQQKRDADAMKVQQAQVDAMHVHNTVMQQLDNMDADQWVESYPKMMKEGMSNVNQDFAFKDNSQAFSLGINKQIESTLPAVYAEARKRQIAESVTKTQTSLDSTSNPTEIAAIARLAETNPLIKANFGGPEQAKAGLSKMISSRISDVYATKASVGGVEGYKLAEDSFDQFKSLYKDKEGNWLDGVDESKKAEFNNTEQALEKQKVAAFTGSSNAMLTGYESSLSMAKNGDIDAFDPATNKHVTYKGWNDLCSQIDKNINDGVYKGVLTEDHQQELLRFARAQQTGSAGAMEKEKRAAFDREIGQADKNKLPEIINRYVYGNGNGSGKFEDPTNIEFAQQTKPEHLPAMNRMSDVSSYASSRIDQLRSALISQYKDKTDPNSAKELSDKLNALIKTSELIDYNVATYGAELNKTGTKMKIGDALNESEKMINGALAQYTPEADYMLKVWRGEKGTDGKPLNPINFDVTDRQVSAYEKTFSQLVDGLAFASDNSAPGNTSKIVTQGMADMFEKVLNDTQNTAVDKKSVTIARFGQSGKADPGRIEFRMTGATKGSMSGKVDYIGSVEPFDDNGIPNYRFYVYTLSKDSAGNDVRKPISSGPVTMSLFKKSSTPAKSVSRTGGGIGVASSSSSGGFSVNIGQENN